MGRKEKKKFDLLLEKVVKSNINEIYDFSLIKVPDISVTMKKFYHNCQNGIESIAYVKSKKKRLVYFKTRKFAIAASAVFITLLGTVLFSNTNNATAVRVKVKDLFFEIYDEKGKLYTDNFNKNENMVLNNSSLSNNNSQTINNKMAISRELTLDEAKKTVPFHFLIPSYIPEGYKFKSTSWSDSIVFQEIRQTYVKEYEDFISITQTCYLADKSVFSDYLEQKKGSEKIVTIKNNKIKIYSSDNNILAVWKDNNMNYEVKTTLTEHELIKLIKGLK